MKRKRHGFLIFLLIILLTAGTNAGNYYYFNIYTQKNLEADLQSARSELDSLDTTVYIAAGDITAGHIMTEADLLPVTVKSNNTIGIVGQSCIGTSAISSIPAGTVLYSTMFYKPDTANNSIVEYNCINLPAGTSAGNFVDVKIRYSNGEDYTILTQAYVYYCTEAVIQLVLSDEQQKLMSSAMTDRKEYTDTTIYAVLYNVLQADADVIAHYIPRVPTAELIYTGNTLENTKILRRLLENRINPQEETQ